MLLKNTSSWNVRSEMSTKCANCIILSTLKCTGVHRFLDLSNCKCDIVGFPQAVLLDPLEIYYSSHPDTPWKFGSSSPNTRCLYWASNIENLNFSKSYHFKKLPWTEHRTPSLPRLHLFLNKHQAKKWNMSHGQLCNVWCHQTVIHKDL